MASLAYIALLCLVLGVLANFGSLHIGTVGKLSLLVLKVGVIGSVWPGSEVIVVAHYVVVWRGDT